ncbi:NTP transferase domain-containing protein [Candidatus Woesearchaeota archaeon]|nr:NTP transferase domain-containing protein [Candidatus Woesearchaeota archaeon]
MKVIIPLAGEGRRMRPHTHTKAKPLLSLAGKPGLSYILDDLKKLDVSEVIFITGHLKEQIEEFIKKNYDFKTRFIEQKVRDGSAGAVLLTEKYIDEPVLIIFADSVFDVDLAEIDKLKKDEDGIIWGMEVQDYRRFGVLVTGKNGYLEKMVEKPDKPISNLANIGVYYIKDYKLMFKGIRYLYNKKINIKGEYFLPDAFAYMINKGAKLLCHKVKAWHDFGKPETMIESNRELLKKGRHREIKTENSLIIPPVHIADDVKIKDSIIGPHVTIGRGAEIINSIVRDSIIGENAKIKDLLLDESIVGDEAVVSDGFKHLSVGDHCEVRFRGKDK